MKKTYIKDMLEAYANKKTRRFHMPGHHGKKRGAFFDAILPYDITELDVSDNIYNPKKGGAVENSLNRAGDLLGCNAVFVTSGATLALQAAIFAVLKKLATNKVICDRRAHISVINALSLLRCEITWLLPDKNLMHDAGELEKLLKNTGKCAVIITSPDYYGRMQNISELSEITHKYSSFLICDNAHGAHLAFADKARHPKILGADITVDSFHKTLPSLTSAAVLYSDFPREDLLFAVRYFGSTSPSFIVAASIDNAFDVFSQKPAIFEKLRENIEIFRKNAKKTGYFFPKFFISDEYRICLSHERYDMRKVYSFLSDNGVVCEFADENNLIMIPSVYDTRADFAAAEKLLKKYAENHKSGIERGAEKKSSKEERGAEKKSSKKERGAEGKHGEKEKGNAEKEHCAEEERDEGEKSNAVEACNSGKAHNAEWKRSAEERDEGEKSNAKESRGADTGKSLGEANAVEYDLPPIPQRVMPIYDAVMESGSMLQTEKAVGLISLRAYYPYPPGIPVIAAGEKITEKIAEILIKSGITEVLAK